MGMFRKLRLSDVMLLVLVDLLILVFADYENENSRKLQQLTMGFWRWKLQEFPEFATTLNAHDFDHYLESYSMSRFQKRKEDCEKFLAEIRKIKRDLLTKNELITLDVLQDQIQTYVTGYKWREYGNLNPINFLEGIHKTLDWIMKGKYVTASHFRELLQRLHRVPTQVSEVKALMNEAVRLNRTNHRVSMVDVPGQIDRLTSVPAEWTKFFRPFNRTLLDSSVSKSDRDWLRRKAVTVIRDEIQPAYADLKTFVLKKYLPATRKTHGVYSFQHGREYYKACLQWHLSENVEPEDLHLRGLKEVERIGKLMQEVIERVRFNGTLLQFFKHLKNDRRFYFKTEKQLLDHYRNMISRRIKPKLRSKFDISDVPPLRVSRMAHDGPSGYYARNTLYINSRRPETRPSYSMVALALHEAYPGHHVQVSTASRKRMPPFRRHIWGGKKYSAPFNFPYYTAYVEGWGLYAEYLGEEMGIYKDQYELFGRYSLEMFRACRLVIDTGIHVKGWTRQKAIYYMSNWTTIPVKQIEKEVDRYITWPGQACAYKFGEFRIRQLRQEAEEKLGSHFNVTEFHDTILRVGALPLRLLDRVVRDWIANNRKRIPSYELQSSSRAQYTADRTNVLQLCAAVLLSLFFKRNTVERNWIV